MTTPSPWAVLGVSETASPATVRRAYKQLCLQVHPDRCAPGPGRTAANEIFAELSTAYETIRALQESEVNASNSMHREEESQEFFSSDEYRRQFAAKFEEKMRSQGETPPGDIFEALFGDSHRNYRFQSELPEAPDMEVALPLTLEEMHNGCLKRRRISRKKCNQVSGILQEEPTIIKIEVEKGWRKGDRIRFRGAGSQDPKSYRGARDIVFIIEEKQHERLTRIGDDLHAKVDISLSDALCGVATHVDGLEGERIPIRVDTVTLPGSTIVVPHRGMSRRGNPEERGELVVKFIIIFPDRLTSGDKRAVREVIGRLEGGTRDANNASSSNIRRSASALFGARSREVSDAYEQQNATMPSLKRSTSKVGRKETNFTDDRSPSGTCGSRRANRRSFGFRWRF